MKWFLSFLELIGRKKVLLAPNGQVIAFRYYVLYLEDDEDKRWIAKFPNAYIHVNLLLDTPDGPDSHTHPWNTWSWMLRGGYWEHVDGVPRYNKEGSIAKLKHGQYHRIVQVLPDTMTLFMHGWRRGPWSFKAKPCENMCETCTGQYGHCVNLIKETPYELHFGGKGKWRAVQWFLSKKIDWKKVARRQRAAAKIRWPTKDEINARAAEEHFRDCN